MVRSLRTLGAASAAPEKNSIANCINPKTFGLIIMIIEFVRDVTQFSLILLK